MFSLKRFMRRGNAPAEVQSEHYTGVDRRQDERRSAFCFVEICGEDGESLIDATIREISAHGAQLRLKSAESLPSRLLVRSQPEKKRNPATLKWMSGVSIGIKFDDEVVLPADERQPVERVCTVESRLFGKTETTR